MYNNEFLIFVLCSHYFCIQNVFSNATNSSIHSYVLYGIQNFHRYTGIIIVGTRGIDIVSIVLRIIVVPQHVQARVDTYHREL